MQLLWNEILSGVANTNQSYNFFNDLIAGHMKMNNSKPCGCFHATFYFTFLRNVKLFVYPSNNAQATSLERWNFQIVSGYHIF